jgi:regulator of protease activity HflC (stomatin/prohibitin superfamily)
VQDRPTYSELLAAAQQFIEADVIPALDGPKKFHARVAANVLAIVRRELEQEEAQWRAEWKRLDALLGAAEPPPSERAAMGRRLRARTEELCERIRRGDADGGPWRAEVLAHVRQTVTEKLVVANPRFVQGQPST